MANIAPGLNFKIGADVRGVNKAIREAERSLKGAMSSFSSIGNSLSLALSLPIAAFTGSSIRAAGEIESLRLALEKTMGGAGRSIDDAKGELEELRKAALAPGLDFQQAVKGSIRLQGVGYEAEEARKIIVELANALSLAGGTADQLDGVTKQFTQMKSKGKIMQEDLTIILENMPNLAKVMQDTFGTSNAEMLRKMGVSVEDFISKLTDGMAKLPRAQGGIANSIVNAQNAIKLAIAEVGEEINKTFNVTGALESFAKWVGDLGKWFRGLDDSTKRTIGTVAVFLAVLGPAFKVMQAGVFVVGKLQVAFLGFQKALALSQTAGGIPGLVGWWKKLDFVMKASYIGIAIAVVLALGAAFAATSKDMSAAAQAQRNFDKTMQDGTNSIALERAELEALVSVAGNETASKKDRLKAMNNLIAINPKYKEALNGEIIDTVKLAAANKQVVESMIAVAKAKAAVARIAEIDTAMSNLAEASAPTFWQSVGNAFSSLGTPLAFASSQVKTLSENMVENRAALEAERAKLMEVATANVHAFGTTQTLTGGVKDLGDEGKKTTDILERLAKPENFAQLPTLNLMPDSLQSQGANPFGKILEGLKGAAAGMETYMSVGEQMGEINKTIQDGIIGTGDAFMRLSDALLLHGQIFQGVVAGSVGAMEALAESGEGIEGMGKAILGSLKKIIGGLVKTGVAAVVTKALLSSALSPFAAIALGAASGALAQAMFNSIINKVKVPALAEGGVLTSPQMVLAGEYAGARTNPEIISPESKMRDVFGEVMAKYGGGGLQGGTLVARVAGDDLLFVLQKAEKRAQRVR